MSIIFTADCHLKDSFLGKVLEAKGDSYLAIEEIIRVCLEDKEQTGDTVLIIGGDLTDVKTPGAHIVGMAKALVDRLKEEGIQTFMLQGNHEYNPEMPWAKVIGAEYLPDHINGIELCGHVVYGLDHMKRDALVSALQAVPENVQVLCVHQALKDALSFVSATGETAYNMEKSDVLPTVRLVLIGDIHITNSYVNDTTVFAYPGSITMQKFNEAPDKYVIKVLDDLSIEFVPIKTRTVVQLIIEDEPAMIQCYQELKGLQAEEPLKALYSITYKSDIPSAAVYIDKIRELGVCHIIGTPVFSTNTEELIAAPSGVTGLEMADYIDEYINKDEQRDEYEFIHALLKSPDKKAFLVNQRKEILK